MIDDKQQYPYLTLIILLLRIYLPTYYSTYVSSYPPTTINTRVPGQLAIALSTQLAIYFLSTIYLPSYPRIAIAYCPLQFVLYHYLSIYSITITLYAHTGYRQVLVLVLVKPSALRVVQTRHDAKLSIWLQYVSVHQHIYSTKLSTYLPTHLLPIYIPRALPIYYLLPYVYQILVTICQCRVAKNPTVSMSMPSQARKMAIQCGGCILFCLSFICTADEKKKGDNTERSS